MCRIAPTATGTMKASAQASEMRDHSKPRNADTILNAFFTYAGNTSTKLDLSSCGLKQLPKLFGSLIDQYPKASERLTLLNLAHNNLEDLPSYLTKLPNLRILFLLRNAFYSVSPVIRTLSSVMMLSFKENLLEGELKSESLPPNLTWLILTSNRITSLDDDFPIVCKHVRKLMLSNNFLRRLPSDMHLHMTNLELLRLANNRFETLPRHVFRLPRLSWIAFAGNPCTMTDRDDLPSSMHIADIESVYDVQWHSPPLGAGASGKTFAAKTRGANDENKDGQAVVVKQFHAMTGSDGRAEDEVELSCLAKDVPHVIHALGYGMIDDTLHLVTKRVQGNPVAIAGPPSFDTCVRSVYKHDLCMSKEDKTRVIACVERAVKGLLQKGICHGDVYAHNVLVAWGDVGEVSEVGSREGAAAEATLADLGAAWKYPNDLKDEVAIIELRALDIFKKEIQSLDESV